ncbi:MAG: type I pullulanase [Christensenellaceae bacterium]
MDLRSITLGAIWSERETTFRLYAPQAKEVTVNLYMQGLGGEVYASHPMQKDGLDLWFCRVSGNLDGTYYTYAVDGVEVIDPYAKSAGANGKRGLIFDLTSTDPVGWASDRFTPKLPIIWEVHVRDFSSDPAMKLPDAGTYGAFRTGVKTEEGRSALVDYIKELGITYVHLLPVMDYASVDEIERKGYNWGYDPASYFYPEGSYASDPFNGKTRVKEFKQLVKTLHENGIGVVLDVVYNHVYKVETSSIGQIAPHVYFRMDGEKYRNGSGCGNETASERAMMRKVMIDSVLYWVREYHVDGFRFDLMGLHDVQTMNLIREELNALPGGKHILMYGEPWYAAKPVGICPSDLTHAHLLDAGIGLFNPELRDGLRGSHFGGCSKGYIQGEYACLRRVKAWISGGTTATEFGGGFRIRPSQQIAYVASHDNYTLYDQLKASTKGKIDYEQAHRLAAFILLSCLGTPFFQAGEEFLHTKGGDGNSYNAGDKVNHLSWKRRDKYADVVDYYRGLIALRKRNHAFEHPNTAEFAWISCDNDWAAAYRIGNFYYCFNNTDGVAHIVLPAKAIQYADEKSTDLHKEVDGVVEVPARGVFLAEGIDVGTIDGSR